MTDTPTCSYNDRINAKHGYGATTCPACDTPTRPQRIKSLIRTVTIRQGIERFEFFHEEDADCKHKWVPWDMEYGGSSCEKCDGWHFISGAR